VIAFQDALDVIIYDPAVLQGALKASDELRKYIGKIVFSGTDHERGPDGKE
jgi:hypothetical protein